MRLSATPIQRRLVAPGLTLLAAATVLSGCLGGGSSASATPTAVATTVTEAAPPSATVTAIPTTPTPTAQTVRTVTPSLLPEAVEAAIDAAAADLDIQRDRIEVVNYSQVEWPSTALGCPEEGKSYAQIVTPGYAVELDALGRHLIYHTNMSGSTVVRCRSEVSTIVPP